jgi:prephenate dehydrogenase
MVYGFVGLGLMGGSFAKALRKGAEKIFALDKSQATIDAALADGTIDEGFEDAAVMLPLCDVDFIGLNPGETLQFLGAHKQYFRKNAIVTDIAGVKTGIAGHLGDFLLPHFDFILGHPMAGSEKEGYGNSSPEIFRGRNYILMPHGANRPESLAFFRQLVTDIGFARIIETDPATHDHKIAFTSQLCHVIACALVESAEDTRITEFGGGSFEDLTRIAMINAPLWTELFLANKTELIPHIKAFETVVADYRVALENGDADALINAMQNVRAKRTEMTKK